MKKLVNGFILLLFLFGIQEVVAQTTSTQVEFAETQWDFGKIKEVDGVVSHTFTFKNVSTTPFIINFVSVSCGCTSPEYSKEPVMPGKTGQITIHYDPAGRPGFFSKEIYVLSNNRKSQNIITIQGTVEPRPRTVEDDYPVVFPDGLRATSNSIAFKNVPAGYRHTMAIGIYNNSDKNITVNTVMPQTAGVSVYASPEVLAPKAKGQILFTYDTKNNVGYGPFSYDFNITVNGNKVSSPIRVRGVVIPDFSKLTYQEKMNAPRGDMDSQFHYFGEVGLSETLTHNFELANNGNRDLIIEAVIPSSSEVTCTLPKKVLKKGEKEIISVTLHPKKSGRISQNVIIVVNDPTDPVKDIRVVANIR